MPVVKHKVIVTSNSPSALTQANLDTHSTSVNTTLATIAPIDVLDVTSNFAPGGKDGIRSTFFTQIIYLE